MLVAILILGRELRLAFVDQHGLRLALAGRGEDDPPVRQVVRRDVVAFLGDDVGSDDPAQHVGRPVVLIDVPGRLLAVHRARDERHAHREDDARAVERGVDVAHVPESAGQALRYVDLRHVGRGAVAKPHVRACLECLELAHVEVVQVFEILGQRAAHVGNRDVQRDRIRRLAAADIDVAVVPGGTRGQQGRCKRQHQCSRIRDRHLNSLRCRRWFLHDRMQLNDCVTDVETLLSFHEYKHLRE